MRRISLIALTCTLASCMHSHADTAPLVMQQGAASALRPMRGRVTDHVIVISVDGLRPDAIAKFGAKTLERMEREGRYSLTAQTISISNTLPAHTSMLTGVDADQHQITWNKDNTGKFDHVQVPTVFSLAHAAGFETAAFYSKSKFHYTEVPATIDYERGPKGGIIPWNSGKTADLVIAHLKHAKPNLTFVHLADPDFAGHNFGWMGRTYGMAVRQADLEVARILDAADDAYGRGAYTVVLTSDHGGHRKGHGTTMPVDLTIPWIVWGQGVQQGGALTGIRTMDTAATVLWMLGLAEPGTMVGKPVTDAFQATVAGR